MGEHGGGQYAFCGLGGNQIFLVADARLRKLKMPIFEGDDLDEWLYRVEHYFMENNIFGEERLGTAAVCLEGMVLAWF